MYASHMNDVVVEYSDLHFPMSIKAGNMHMISVHEHPSKLIIPMQKPGRYVSWHLSALEHYEKKWKQFDYLEQLVNKYKPSIDFTLPSRYALRVPLAE